MPLTRFFSQSLEGGPVEICCWIREFFQAILVQKTHVFHQRSPSSAVDLWNSLDARFEHRVPSLHHVVVSNEAELWPYRAGAVDVVDPRRPTLLEIGVAGGTCLKTLVHNLSFEVIIAILMDATFVVNVAISPFYLRPCPFSFRRGWHGGA